MIKSKIVMFGFFSVVIIAAGLYFSKKGNKPNNLSNVTPTGVIQSKPTATSSASVPLPTEEDIIRTFFELINEKRISEAVNMMSLFAIPNDSAKQEWGVNFNAISSVKVTKIEAFDKTSWTNTKHEYKVTLQMTVTPDSASAPIPHYGWENGINTRWIIIEKNNEGLWRISSLATGP